MAKYKAVYDSESDVPEEVKAFYIKSGGKWKFNDSEFEGVAELTNPGLASKKDELLTKLTAAKTDRDAYKERAEKAETEVNTLKKPGTVVITNEDNQMLEQYKAIGPVKDIEAKIQKGEQDSEQLGKLTKAQQLRQTARKAGIDEEAFIDFANSERGRDLVFDVKKAKVKDAKGKEIETDTLVVVKTDEINGKQQTSDIVFSKWAEDNSIPKYLVNAIFTNQPAPNESVKNKVYIPPTVTKPADDGESGKQEGRLVTKRLQHSNESRNTRQFAWTQNKKQEQS